MPALLVAGLLTVSQSSLADEIVSANEIAPAADIPPAVTANGERLVGDEPLTVAQVAIEAEQESHFPNETEVDRVVVTGTNIVSDSPPFVPETIFNREAVERSGSRSLGDFFQSLPQNSGPTFSENQSDSLAPGGAAVALRGLGPDATLVLVNGRRVAPYPFAQNGITAFVDLNSLPLAAIQQIDILRDGASAIYGTDAIAGVVNIRFLEKYDGALVTIGYGNTTDTDTSEYRASLITGYTDERRGTELVVVADYFHREALFQTDRFFSLSIDQRRQGGSSFLSSVSNPGTVFDPVTGDPLMVPANSDGTPEVSEFLPGRTRFDRAPFQPLIPETERFGFTTRAKIRLAPAVDLFTEFGYRNIFTKQQLAPAPIEGDVEGISVPAANPFNPFGTDVVFRYRVTEAGPRIDEIDSDFYRAVAGINVQLPGRWGLESALLFSETDTKNTSFNNLSRSAVIAALADTNPATSFNVFGAGNNVNNPATIRSFLVTTTREGQSRIYGADAKMNGPLFSLPAGELLTAFGMEYRHEDLEDRFDPFSTAGGVIDLNSTSASGNRDIIAGFAEFYAPIVSNQMAIPGIHKLEAQFAVRAENYSDFGSTVNPKIGLAWQPIPDWLLLRASWSTGFRAPSLVQSSTGSLTFSQELRDTRRFEVTGLPEDETAALQILSGGNPDLGSEDSESFSTGLVLTPPSVPGLTLSADYFHIQIENSIASLDPQFILDNEGDFPGLVVRAPPSASDIALGIPGNVLLVNTSFQNLGFIKVEGIDAMLEYITPKTPVGTFTFRIDAAYMHSFEQQASEGEPVRELVRTFARPQLRGRAQLGWRIGSFEAITTFNYIDSYLDLPADRTVDYSTTVDVLLEYRFAKAEQRVAVDSKADAGKEMVESVTQTQRSRWLDGLAVRVGVRNIFDDPPPFANNVAGFPVPLEDPRQRFVFLDIEKKF
ncbi:MAG TPA: TonB-dependent receptor [Chthoniobacterales bacterium]|nr:TonB-dependent receptor [Chthoniobacterales bacterium]